MHINVLMNHLNEIKLLLIENLKALITYPPPDTLYPSLI